MSKHIGKRNFSKLLFSVALMFFFSCSSSLLTGSLVEKELQGSIPVLGAVGNIKLKLLKTEFISKGMPFLDRPVRLAYNIHRLNKTDSTFLVNQNKSFFSAEDSLSRHYYFTFRIADEVGLLDAFNKESNNNLKEYLVEKEDTRIILAEDIFFPDGLADKILKASDCYLVEDLKGTYFVKIVNTDNSEEMVHWSDGILLKFTTKDFCWKKDFRGKVKLAGFKNIGASCKGNTYHNPQKLNKKDVFDKI